MKGIVQTYTGSGKGKTSAAWGQALRAAGYGKRIAITGFLKNRNSGELSAAERLRPEVSVFGYTSVYDPNEDQRHSDALKEETRSLFRRAAELIKSGDFDLVILDEINTVLDYEFVGEEELISAIDARPDHVDIILTGRYAPESVVSASDLVTEMKEIKHPFSNGKKARSGIEY